MARPRLAIDVDDLVRRYEGGEPVVAIARDVGVSHTLVQDRLRERGVLRGVAEDLRRYKRERMLTLPVEEIARRYRAGTPALSLARAYGVSRSAIELRLVEAGVLVAERRTTANARRRRPGSGVEGPHHRALTAEKRLYCVGAEEERLLRALEQAMLPVRPQGASGRYNVDILVDETVAVEVMTCPGTPYGAARYEERLEHLLDRHVVLVVWAPQRYPLVPLGVEKVVALVEQLRRDPPSRRGQYWVVRGDGEVAVRGDDPQDITRVPAAVRTRHTSRTHARAS